MKVIKYKQILIAFALSQSLVGMAKTDIGNLRVQHTVTPLAIEDALPGFSWQMTSDEQGQCQKGYQIMVFDRSSHQLVWDSKKIKSALSTNIRYAGNSLRPETTYDWTVKVWDANGKKHEKHSFFSTGLMDTTSRAWEGAEWIGSKENNLSAYSDYYFCINTSFRMLKGRKVSFILGANDFRLKDAFQNIENMEGENYVRIELDFTGIEAGQGAVLNIYRVGYAPGDSKEKPLFSICKKNYPQTNINDLFTRDNWQQEHHLSIRVETSNVQFVVDGKGLISFPYELPFWLKGKTGVDNVAASPMNVGQCGNTHDYNSFPNLCSVGFAAMPESKVLLTNYTITNRGCSEDNVVFSQMQYDRFNSIPCVKVEKDSIWIDNEKKAMQMGYVDPSHGSLTMLRTAFQSSKAISSAKLYATAMGAFEFYINGKRVGKDWFAPGNSQYREVLGYTAYDVTHLIQDGDNAMGALLIPAWFTGFMTYITPNFNFWGDHEALMAKLVINYTDGTRQVITTHPETWKKYNDSAWRYGNFYNGEVYDANKEDAISGWATTSFQDSSWTKADTIGMRPWLQPKIEARYDSPVRVREMLDAQRVMPVHSSDAHTYTYDMGVNMVGVPQITIPKGWVQQGDTIIVRYGEQLYPGLEGDEADYIRMYGKSGKNIAGRILQANLRAALVTDFYIAKNSDQVVYTPRSTYRGYQYIQITLPSHKGALPLENIKGLVLSSDSLPTGTYHAETWKEETGKMINQLFKNIQRSQMGNFFTIPTDCPQRNERMGWTGDAQAYARTATYNSNVYNFFRQWMRSLRADQGEGSDVEAAGGIGSTVPDFTRERSKGFADGATWAAAVCMVPWQLYTQYGDIQIIKDNMEAMKAWLDGMNHYPFSKKYPHLSAKASGLGDWLAMDDRTPADMVNNAIYIYMMEVTAKMAKAIGMDDYAENLLSRRLAAVNDWNACYVDAATGMTRNDKGELVHTQSSYATGLNFNCFDENNKSLAVKWLAELATTPSKSGNGGFAFPDYTITTGFSGTPNILPALSKSGKADIAYKMFTCKDYTSWLYPVSKGATSIWERWNGFEAAFGQKTENNMNSFNHFALGAVGQWMYEYQLGIVSGADGGYKHFVLQPMSASPFMSLSGSYDSEYGKIVSEWVADRQGKMTHYHTVVPANTTATLYLPVYSEVPSSPKGVKFVKTLEHNGTLVAEYKLPSGDYHFKF